MKQLTLENFKAFGSDKAVLGSITSDGQPMNDCVMAKMELAKVHFMRL